MYGHVNQYLDTQALRLRAERAERLAGMWRLTGWAFGLALVCLLGVVVWQEQELAESHAYSSHAERSERDAQKAETACEDRVVKLEDEIYQFSEQARDSATALETAKFELGACRVDVEWVRKAQFQHFTDLGKCRAELADAEKLYEGQESEIYVALQRAVDAEEVAETAKKSFAICKSANAGLVESLQDFDRLVKDQQALIAESVEMAKRCEVSPVTWAETPITWAAEAPAAWQVVGHAR